MEIIRCLFCKRDSANTKSVEHIVPESLGNKKFILPIGYVCDKCNNYFAREVEKPFLEQSEIKLLRFQQAIPNKKNRIPLIDGKLDGKYEVKMERSIIRDEVVNAMRIPSEIFEKIKNSNTENTQVILPAFTNSNILKSNKIVSRFIAKVALESLVERFKLKEGGLEYLVNDFQFDLIRRHAREGTTPNWPCHIRRIYEMDKEWLHDGEMAQMVYECDFLFVTLDDEIIPDNETVNAELYFIIALLGLEFAINMGGPDIEGYEQWLKRHNDVSPLYYGKNEIF